jgi:hypothetical protein
MTPAAQWPVAGEACDSQKFLVLFFKKEHKKRFFLRKEIETFLCRARLAWPAHAAHD